MMTVEEEVPMEPKGDGRVVAGTILVIVGAALLIMQFVEDVGQGILLVGLGAAFLVGYLLQRNYGLLVAGGVVLGVGLGQLGDRVLDVGGGVEPAGLGIGFLTIYVVERATGDTARWWPLVPGLILLVAGLSEIDELSEIIDYTWPLLLVLVGVVMILRGPRRRSRS